MHCEKDNNTIEFMKNNCPNIFLNLSKIEEQYKGRRMNMSNWHNKVKDIKLFPSHHSAPENIIQAFNDNNYLNGLAMVVSWGTMWMQNRTIYCYESSKGFKLDKINKIL